MARLRTRCRWGRPPAESVKLRPRAAFDVCRSMPGATALGGGVCVSAACMRKRLASPEGWGFITYNGADLFLHVKECLGFRPVAGDWVAFDLEEDTLKGGGQMKATRITGGSGWPLDGDKGWGKGAAVGCNSPSQPLNCVSCSASQEGESLEGVIKGSCHLHLSRHGLVLVFAQGRMLRGAGSELYIQGDGQGSIATSQEVSHVSCCCAVHFVIGEGVAGHRCRASPPIHHVVRTPIRRNPQVRGMPPCRKAKCWARVVTWVQCGTSTRTALVRQRRLRPGLGSRLWRLGWQGPGARRVGSASLRVRAHMRQLLLVWSKHVKRVTEGSGSPSQLRRTCPLGARAAL